MSEKMGREAWRVWEEGISRRSFLRSAAFASLAGWSIFPLLEACGGSSTPATVYPSTFKLGNIFGLSGTPAAQGKQFQQGIELAVIDQNKKGGIDGIQIEAVYEDSQAQPALAVTAAQKLINVDQVQVFTNVSSSPVLAVDPIADKAKVLQVTAAANSPRLINASKYFLASVPNSTFEVQVGLTLAKKHFNFTKTAFIYRNDDLGNGVKDFFTSFWGQQGGQILTVQSHEPTQTDFASLASKVAAASPEFIYITSASATQGLLVKQLRQAGATVPIISGVGLAVNELFSVGGAASKDCYWTSPSSSLNPTGFAAFSSEYQAAYAGQTLSTFTSQHYDVAMAIFAAATAVKKAGQPLDGTHIRDAMLAHGVFVGVQGPFTPHADGSCTRAEDINTALNGKASTFLTARQVQDQGIYNFGLS